VSLRAAALGVALCEAQRRVREEGGNNLGPRIREYAENADPPIHVAAAWCALLMQFVADVAAAGMEVVNPLDEVKLEALVQSYFNWASERGLIVTASEAEAGDLALFRFHGERYDHIGMVRGPMREVGGRRLIPTVEGNTNDGGSRDGDGVYLKIREVNDRVIFVRWAA
jgi:hypothetical protein